MAARANHAPVTPRLRELDVVSEALAEAERARRELLAANERLRRSNAELRRLQRALETGLEAIDEWSEGRLRELVEQTGDELAALVHLVLDGNEGKEW
jgi:hypothetical protein